MTACPAPPVRGGAGHAVRASGGGGEAGPGDAGGRALPVLGGDRPGGTFLRARPDTATRLLVAHPEADACETGEIRDDPRVTLLPAGHLTPRGACGAVPGAGWRARTGRGARSRRTRSA
ncbi:hypothetical protein [Streptomyces nitrosporeus]|uniref:hypothetical protein n=1 Tax=Streptomyces nitrosporeus TaxID=28894 RepID=UPI00123C8B5B|nr:hypothetical protein [Streptomyces nitrosporeus]